MGTKKTTQTTNQYAPGALNQYQAFQQLYGPLLQNWASNPYNNQQFSQNLSQNMQYANQSSMNAINNAMRNFNMTGMNNAPSGARTQLMGQLGRLGSANNANAFYNAVNTANQRQTGAVGAMMSYQPLQTGGTQTQTTGGVGSWLPQLAGAALGAGLGFATGGASTLMGNLGGGIASQIASSGAQGPSSFGGNYPAAPISSAPNPFSASMNAASPSMNMSMPGSGSPNFLY